MSAASFLSLRSFRREWRLLSKTVKILSRIFGPPALPVVAWALFSGVAWAQPAPQPSGNPSPAAPSPTVLSSAAERVYENARPKLLQIRTLVALAGRQSSIGSGFLVSADGLAITNYHVVSQYALEPQSYRLEYTTADGTSGGLTLAAIDLANDLAVVRLDKGGHSFFQFDERALSGGLPHGERLYSMGNPLDLGFTITEGTYNGLVDRSYNERIHFSGALNPGMSGGPTVTADGRVAGVNVAKRLGGEQVAFLVPAGFAATLVERAKGEGALTTPAGLRAEIGRQLTAWQAGFYGAVEKRGFRSSGFGPYRALESEAPWFSCWGRTSDGQIPKPRATLNMTICSSDTQVFVANDLATGAIQFSHAHYRSVDLNQFQFAAFLSSHDGRSWRGGGRKWFTRERCHEDFIAPHGEDGPPLRAVWCARAYREFEGLYDVWMTTVTQDRGDEALVSRLSLSGVSYDNATALTKRFLEAVTWSKRRAAK